MSAADSSRCTPPVSSTSLPKVPGKGDPGRRGPVPRAHRRCAVGAPGHSPSRWTGVRCPWRPPEGFPDPRVPTEHGNRLWNTHDLGHGVTDDAVTASGVAGCRPCRMTPVPVSPPSPRTSSMSTPCSRPTTTGTPIRPIPRNGWCSARRGTAARRCSRRSTTTTSRRPARRSSSTGPRRARRGRCSSAVTRTRCPSPRGSPRARSSWPTTCTCSSTRPTATPPPPPSPRRSSAPTATAPTAWPTAWSITPIHNPPRDGGFKYNPPHGGPADTDATSWIANRANELLVAKLDGVRRHSLDRNASGPLRLHGRVRQRPAERRRPRRHPLGGRPDRSRPAGRRERRLLGRDRRAPQDRPHRRQPRSSTPSSPS